MQSAKVSTVWGNVYSPGFLFRGWQLDETILARSLTAILELGSALPLYCLGKMDKQSCSSAAKARS